MKKIIVLLILILVSLMSYSQDTLVATHFTEKIKTIKALVKPKKYIFTKVAIGRSEFYITEGNTLIFSGYVKKFVIVKTQNSKDLTMITRHLVVVDKKDNVTEKEYYLTMIQNRLTKRPIRFIVLPLKDKEASKVYLGKII